MQEKINNIHVLEASQPSRLCKNNLLGVDYEFSIDDNGLCIEIPINKQETIEKAIEQELENYFFSNISEIKQAEYFINFGAKWQQERMYSIIDEYINDVMGGCNLRFEEWFEQFKKK